MSESNKINLYHTGFEIIKAPDVHVGRVNADFGQGFYLSTDLEFSRRWAQPRKGQTIYINHYTLDCENLKVKTFSRNMEWYEYINGNRNGKADRYAEYDVIIGPIAIDTIYDMYGVTTSGYIEPEDALRILSIGPVYTQVTLKTERATAALFFIQAEVPDAGKLAEYRALLSAEEDAFQEEFAELLGDG